MDNSIKKQVFDVLDEGGFYRWGAPFQVGDNKLANEALFDLMEIEPPTTSVINTIIPDDIESKMLDWLEEQDWSYKFWNNIGLLVIDNGDKASEGSFDIRHELRQVAIAQACVWVYNQLNSQATPDSSTNQKEESP